MTSKFEISDFVEPVPGARSLFRARLEAMPLGKAIIVAGMKHGNAVSRAYAIGRQCDPKRKFSVATLTDGSLQITRLT